MTSQKMAIIPIWLATTIIVTTVVVVLIVGLLLACIINEHVVRPVQKDFPPKMFCTRLSRRSILCTFFQRYREHVAVKKALKENHFVGLKSVLRSIDSDKNDESKIE